MTTETIINYAFGYQLRRKIYKLNELIAALQKNEAAVENVLRDVNNDLQHDLVTLNMIYSFLHHLISLLEKVARLDQQMIEAKVTDPIEIMVTWENIGILFWYIKMSDEINNLYAEIAYYTDDLYFMLVHGLVENLEF